MRELLASLAATAGLVLATAFLPPEEDDEDTLPKCPSVIPEWMLEDA